MITPLRRLTLNDSNKLVISNILIFYGASRDVLGCIGRAGRDFSFRGNLRERGASNGFNTELFLDFGAVFLGSDIIQNAYGC
jgi:hypothetical protein